MANVTRANVLIRQEANVLYVNGFLPLSLIAIVDLGRLLCLPGMTQPAEGQMTRSEEYTQVISRPSTPAFLIRPIGLVVSTLPVSGQVM